MRGEIRERHIQAIVLASFRLSLQVDPSERSLDRLAASLNALSPDERAQYRDMRREMEFIDR